MSEQDFPRFLDAAKVGSTYKREKVIIDFTEQVVSRMHERDLSRADLAVRLGKIQVYITKILRGEFNFTLETMSLISAALNMQLSVGMSPTQKESIT